MVCISDGGLNENPACNEPLYVTNCRWWRAFTTAGCCSGYIFVYSIYYAFSRLQMARTAAFLVYLGYMGVVRKILM